MKLLQLLEPLLCNNREISKYTRIVSRQRLVKHVPMATDTHETIQVLIEMEFLFDPFQVVTRRTIEARIDRRASRVEPGSNTSTVALRVVGGDEKGSQCLGV
jgi:hypothetical protein